MDVTAVVDPEAVLDAGRVRADGEEARTRGTVTVAAERVQETDDGVAAGTAPGPAPPWCRMRTDPDGLYIATDPFGMERVYLAEVDGATVVSTDLARIARMGGFAVDRGAVAHYLRYGFVPPGRTGLDGVQRIGLRDEVRIAPDGTVRMMERAEPYPGGGDGFRDALDVAVADVAEPVVALSGGLDSTLLLDRIAADGEAPSTVTVRHGANHDDVAAGTRVSERYGTAHATVALDGDAVADMAGAYRAAGGTLAFPNPLLLYRELHNAADGTVVLGVGPTYLFATRYRRWVRRARWGVRIPNALLRPLQAGMLPRPVRAGARIAAAPDLATTVADRFTIQDRDTAVALVGEPGPGLSGYARDVDPGGAFAPRYRDLLARVHLPHSPVSLCRGERRVAYPYLHPAVCRAADDGSGDRTRMLRQAGRDVPDFVHRRDRTPLVAPGQIAAGHGEAVQGLVERLDGTVVDLDAAERLVAKRSGRQERILQEQLAGLAAWLEVIGA